MEFGIQLLPSGKYQVKFAVGEFYGYLLAEPKEPVREVIGRIIRHVDEARKHDVNSYYQRNLYSIGLRKPASGRFLLFRQSTGVSEKVPQSTYKTIMNEMPIKQESKAA